MLPLNVLALTGCPACAGGVFIDELCFGWSVDGEVETSFTLEEAVMVATIGFSTGVVVCTGSGVETAGVGAEVATGA